MFTRKRWVPPILTKDWERDGPNLLRSINEYLLSLEAPESLTLDQIASIATNGLIDISASTAGQIQFPATQNASSDANTLDDYEEGTTTPTPTAGSGAFTTVSSTVNYTKVGRLVAFDCVVTITTNGTAGTYVAVPLPFTAANIAGMGGYKDTTVGLSCVVNGANLFMFRYDGAYPGADGVILYVSGAFRV